MTKPSLPFDMEKELSRLTPEQVELFLRALELTMKKRRLMMYGYLGALVCILAGLIGALYIWAALRAEMFITWVFLIPFACAGGLIVLFGRRARSLGTSRAAHPGDSRRGADGRGTTTTSSAGDPDRASARRE